MRVGTGHAGERIQVLGGPWSRVAWSSAMLQRADTSRLRIYIARKRAFDRRRRALRLNFDILYGFSLLRRAEPASRGVQVFQKNASISSITSISVTSLE